MNCTKKVQEQCPICLDDTLNDFYTIRSCKHEFCKRCLADYIYNLENFEQINCPFNSSNEKECKSIIDDDELKIFLDENSYKKYSCSKTSTQSKISLETSSEEFKDLLDTGIIIRCPRCNILIEKYDSGCQFVRCFVCKLDICWLTKKPRWGPKGKGDTSSGCQCGLNGQKCHPMCLNCH